MTMRTSYRDIFLLACCQALLLVNNAGLIAMAKDLLPVPFLGSFIVLAVIALIALRRRSDMPAARGPTRSVGIARGESAQGADALVSRRSLRDQGGHAASVRARPKAM